MRLSNPSLVRRLLGTIDTTGGIKCVVVLGSATTAHLGTSVRSCLTRTTANCPEYTRCDEQHDPHDR